MILLPQWPTKQFPSVMVDNKVQRFGEVCVCMWEAKVIVILYVFPKHIIAVITLIYCTYLFVPPPFTPSKTHKHHSYPRCMVHIAPRETFGIVPLVFNQTLQHGTAVARLVMSHLWGPNFMEPYPSSIILIHAENWWKREHLSISLSF